MSEVIHQAIYGEINNSHSFIKSTFDDEQLAKELTNLTDLPSLLPFGIDLLPYISGFSFNNYYIISKSYPDKSANREGMLFTHVLFIPHDEIGNLNDLAGLLAVFSSPLNKTISITPLPLKDYYKPNQMIKVADNRTKKLVKGLLSNNIKSSLIWIGQDSFETAITLVWNNLWDKIRKKLFFRISFGPDDLNNKQYDDMLKIICSPTNLISKWDGYYVIDDNSSVIQLENKAELFLAGDSETYNEITDFISQIGLTPEKISDLRIIEDTIHHLHNHHKIENLILLLRNLVYLIPDNKEDENTFKNKFFKVFIDSFPEAKIKDVINIKNLNIKAFHNGEQYIKLVLSKWIKQNLFNAYKNGVNERFLSELITRKTSSWWKDTILITINNTLNEWRSEFAKILWNWIIIDKRILDAHVINIPKNEIIEKNIVDYCPDLLDDEILKYLKIYAKNRNWLCLYFAIILKLNSPTGAIDKLLEIENIEDEHPVFEVIQEKIEEREIIDYSISHDDNRILSLAIKICKKNHHHLSRLDINNKNWRTIWIEASKNTSNPWFNIQDQKDVLLQLLDLIIDNAEIDDNFLMSLINNNYLTDLSDYSNRKKIWNHLPRPVKNKFLSTTSKIIFYKYCKDEICYREIENEIVQAIKEDEKIIISMLASTEYSIAKKIDFFNNFKNLKEELFSNYMIEYTEYLFEKDAILIGKFVMYHNYKKSAKKIKYLLETGKLYFEPALKECKELIRQNLFDKLYDRMENFLSLLDPFSLLDREVLLNLDEKKKDKLLKKYNSIENAKSEKQKEKQIDKLKEYLISNNILESANLDETQSYEKEVNIMIKKISVELMTFLKDAFGNPGDFPLFCIELGENENNYTGNYDVRILNVVRKIERDTPDAYKVIYDAVMKLKPKFKEKICTLFEVEYKPDISPPSLDSNENNNEKENSKLLKELYLLHISDIHFTLENEWNLKGLFLNFLNDIEKWRKKSHNKIDIFCLTGDIVQSGNTDQYEAFQTKLDTILLKTGCPKNQTFIIPGNHDMQDFDKCSIPYKSLLERINDNEVNINDDVLSGTENYQYFLDKFKNYTDFLKKGSYDHCLWHHSSEEHVKPWYSITLDDFSIEIIGLNSALFSCKGYARDGELRMGSRQLEEAIYHNKNNYLKLILTHHPLDWLVRDEREQMETTMSNTKAIHFHGHVHKSKRKLYSFNKNQKHFSISGGSLYGEGGNKYYNTYQIIKLEFCKNKINIIPSWIRRWEPDEQNWFPDPRWSDDFTIDLE